MITSHEIQKRLSEEIKDSHLSQAEIAKKVGITQSSIAHYIRGAKLPNIDTFANICRAIDADPRYILCLTDSD